MLAQIRGGGRRRGCAPLHPLLSGGLRPPDPTKRRSPPLAAAVVRFLAALLPGGRAFSRKSDFFLNKPLLPGSFADWGRTFSRQFSVLRRNHLSRAASLPGAELVLENLTFFEQATCPGQLRCLGQIFFRKIMTFFEQATCPGQLRCLGQNICPEIVLFEETTCPGQVRCLGQNFFQNIFF